MVSFEEKQYLGAAVLMGDLIHTLYDVGETASQGDAIVHYKDIHDKRRRSVNISSVTPSVTSQT